MMFSVKEVSKNLGITPQAIYKQKEELEKKGYMVKNQSEEFEITVDGYNYLVEKRANQLKQQSVSLKNVEQKNIDKSSENNFVGLNETLVNLYEKRIKELKENYESQLKEQKQQVDYFKNLYEQEKKERIQTNAQYQTYLLGTAEDNKKNHWWQFRKNNTKGVNE